MWEFTTACKRRRYADEVGNDLLLRTRLLSTPALNSSEKSDPLRRFKLIRSVAPGLEERIGQDCIAHDSPPQDTCQNPVAPCTIQIPVIRHIMIVTDHVGRNVCQSSTHLWQTRLKGA